MTRFLDKQVDGPTSSEHANQNMLWRGQEEAHEMEDDDPKENSHFWVEKDRKVSAFLFVLASFPPSKSAPFGLRQVVVKLSQTFEASRQLARSVYVAELRWEVTVIGWVCGYGSKPKVPFWEWLLSQGSLF